MDAPKDKKEAPKGIMASKNALSVHIWFSFSDYLSCQTFTLLFPICQELFFPKVVSFIVALFMHFGNKIKSFNDFIKGALDENL
jgi:hypothetical protein